MTSWVEIESVGMEPTKIVDHGSEREGTVPHGIYIHKDNYERIVGESKGRIEDLTAIRNIVNQALLDWYDSGDAEELATALKRIKHISDYPMRVMQPVHKQTAEEFKERMNEIHGNEL